MSVETELQCVKEQLRVQQEMIDNRPSLPAASAAVTDGDEAVSAREMTALQVPDY